MANVYHGRGYVYSIQYHIVWCVKYRHKVLNSKIESKLLEILNKIAEDNNFNILEIILLIIFILLGWTCLDLFIADYPSAKFKCFH